MFGLDLHHPGGKHVHRLAPVMVMLALAIGLDSITGAAIILLGGAIFSTGTLNPEYHGRCAENRRASAVLRY